MPLDQLHLTVKTFCDAVIPGKNGTFGPLLPANYAMPCPERATARRAFFEVDQFYLIIHQNTFDRNRCFAPAHETNQLFHTKFCTVI